MPLTKEQLDAIKKRNHERKRLKNAASPGPWEYDSFGFVFQAETVPVKKRLGILVRPMKWFNMLTDKYGKLIDQGFRPREFVTQVSSPECPDLTP